MAPGKMSFVYRPLFRSKYLGLHDLLRKWERRWPSQKASTSIVIGSSTLPWIAPKELILLKQMQAERDEWLRLADYS